MMFRRRTHFPLLYYRYSRSLSILFKTAIIVSLKFYRTSTLPASPWNSKISEMYVTGVLPLLKWERDILF